MPPPVTFKVPEREGVNVRVPAEPTMVFPIVSPLKEEVVVPMPTFPVCVCPVGPIERTPVFVTFPPEYARPEEKVVVATHDGTPLAQESIWPPVP